MKTKNTVDFFLVGAARCGTTSLYNYLNNCEDIFLPMVKEPNYFSEVDSPKSEDFDQPKPNVTYHSKIINSLDVYNALYENSRNNQLKGDTSPSYLWDTNAAKRIFEHNPKAKIIISLRHPVDRAYSHYIMNYYTGVDTNKTFRDALNAKKNDVWGSCNYYLEMGDYYNQVKAYFEVFPEDQIKILVYEDWTKNLNELNSLFNFLNIKATDSVYNTVESNKIKPVKKIYILNFLRQNGIKRVFKKILSQERIDKLKSYLFSDNKEIEKLDRKLRAELFKGFEKNTEKLSELTHIDFIEKWH